jgi:prepilin-type N-terminal cleavage/methylation domain-containing protein
MRIYLHPAGRFFFARENMVTAPYGNTRGITLAEMMIVVVIMGILASIAVPNLARNIPRIRLKGDARDVASVFRLARMRAVAECRHYGVHFNDGQTPPEYALFHDTDKDGVYNVAADSTLFSAALYRKTQITEVNFSDDVAIFYPDGSSNGGWISLGLVGEGDSLVVDILPSTGRVKVVR